MKTMFSRLAPILRRGNISRYVAAFIGFNLVINDGRHSMRRPAFSIPQRLHNSTVPTSIPTQHIFGDRVESAITQLKEAEWRGASTEEIIVLEKAVRDAFLNSHFTPTRGFRVETDVPLPKPIMTASGKAVPESYTSLSYIKRFDRDTRSWVVHAVHLYSHEYSDLTIHDVIRKMDEIGKEVLRRGNREGNWLFGNAMFGMKIAFFEVHEDLLVIIRHAHVPQFLPHGVGPQKGGTMYG